MEYQIAYSKFQGQVSYPEKTLETIGEWLPEYLNSCPVGRDVSSDRVDNPWSPEVFCIRISIGFSPKKPYYDAKSSAVLIVLYNSNHEEQRNLFRKVRTIITEFRKNQKWLE